MLQSSQIASYAGLDHCNFRDFTVKSVSPPDDLSPGDLTLCTRPNEFDELFKNAPPQVIAIVPIELKNCSHDYEQFFLFSFNPCIDFIKIINKFFINQDNTINLEEGIHPTAIIDSEADIHPSVKIGAYSIIDKCVIGEDTEIYDNVHIFPNVNIGERVIIGSSCTIGTHGFNFPELQNGKRIKFPHLGGLIIENDVEIFPLTNIDRGTLGNTIIREGVKIDHCCHIGHNVEIGRDTCITANTVIGGSTKIGQNVWIGPNSVLRNIIRIRNKVLIGMGSVVTKSFGDDIVIAGNPAKFLRENR